MLAWLALLIGVLGVTALMLLRVRQAQSVSAAASSDTALPIAPRHTAETSGTLVPFQTEVTIDAQAECYRLAFAVRRSDYRILGPHQQILQQVERSLPQALREQRHFPRRPSLLPKLLRTLNDKGSTRDEISRLILQDPILAGNVLQRANSAFYRQQNAPAVESVDRAVVILGVDGLRAPVAAAAMQPVFRTPQGFFERFAPMTWQQAHYSALAAEAYARVHRGGDPFIAHLAALLGGLGRIVLFRLVLDQYRERGNLMPRPEVFIQSMMTHARVLSRRVAAEWQMSDGFLSALDAQIEQQLPAHMKPLARALYFGELAGMAGLLVRHESRTPDQANELLAQQGVDNDTIAVLLRATEAAAA